MKLTVAVLITSILLLGSSLAGAKPLDEYVQTAQKHHQSGYLQKAVEVLEEAVAEHPESSDAHAHLGLYLGMAAGESNDMEETMRLIESSFRTADKAVALDPESPLAHLNRGIIALNVPDFLGKMDMGIEDLEFALKAGQGKFSVDQIVTAYDLLGQAYQKKGALDKARDAWEEVIESAPGTELAKNAEVKINQLAQAAEKKKQQEAQKPPDSEAVRALRDKIEKDPGNGGLLLQLGRTYYEEGHYDDAEKTLNEAIALDDADAASHKLLAMVLLEKVSKGYDEKIYDDTDYRTNLAFAVMKSLDKAVALDPDDMELRLLRGIMGVEMPFFVKKLDQGIADLEMVVESDAPDDTRAKALFYAGQGYRKKSTTAWIEVVTEYADSPTADLAFGAMDPGVQRFDRSEHTPPFVAIDFVLGFQDELAPQTAVWIENAAGDFVQTLYASGFAGFVKERQITLPIWAQASNFVDADAITGASIDIGHHIYSWDLKDHLGKEVKSGQYTVKVEVSHWPSMLYQLVEATVELGKKEAKTIVEEGSFIPSLVVTYYPK